MNIKNREYFDKDLPVNIPITERTIQLTVENSNRIRGSVRAARGNFYTDKNYYAFVKDTWAKKLP